MKRKNVNAGYSTKLGKRRRKRRLFKIWLSLFLFVVLVVGFAFLMRQPFLQVKSINIVGTVSIDGASVKNLVNKSLEGNYFGILPRSNILFLDSKNIENTLLESFAKIDEVDVVSKPNGDINVEIKERQAIAVWCSTSEQCFLVDMEGFLYARASSADTIGKLIFGGNIEGEPLKSRFASSEEMNGFIGFTNELKVFGINSTKLRIESKDKAVLETSIGKIFVAPLEKDYKEIAENVHLLLKEEKKKNPEVYFEYIDMRFGNKLFYKSL